MIEIIELACTYHTYNKENQKNYHLSASKLIVILILFNYLIGDLVVTV
jgi:hypothetical protein